jgi:hypothetical protein
MSIFEWRESIQAAFRHWLGRDFAADLCFALSAALASSSATGQM